MKAIRRRVFHAPATCIVMCMLSLCGGTVRAEGTLQEVVVTATKRADPLSKVPISVAAYTQSEMDAQGVRSINDIVAQTPGLDVEQQYGGNGAGIRISIRGIDSNTGASTTGVYIDDTPIQARNNSLNASGTSFPEVFDLERVEVLRGPQGTLFGAGAEGGVVRFITNQPSLTRYSGYARAEASGTDHGTPSGELGVAFGGPVIDGTLGFRVSAWDRHDGGYIDRRSWESPDFYPDSNWANTKVLRAAVTFAPSSALIITPSVQFQEQYDHDASSYWNLLSAPGDSKFVAGFQTRQPSDDSTTLASLNAVASFDEMTLTSITSYFHRNNASVVDITNTDTASVLGVDYTFPVSPDGGLYTVSELLHAAQDVYTQEVRLQNENSDSRLNWLGGVFLSEAKLQDSVYEPALEFPAVLQQATGVSFEDFFGAGLLDGIYEYTGVESSTDTQAAVFGNLSYRITEAWTLTAGLRWAETKIKYSIAENGPEGPYPDALAITKGSQTDHPITPKIGFNWSPNGHNLVYGSIAKGYRIGGVNDSIPAYCGSAAQEIAKPTYQSDTTMSYEIGVKSRPAGGKLQVDASVFHVDWDNIQQSLNFTCGYGFTANSGKARSDGFDLALEMQITDHLTAATSVGYTDAKYTRSVFAPSGALVTAAGETLGQTPWTLFGSLEYRVKVLGNRDAYVRVQDKYKSRNNGQFEYQNPEAFNFNPLNQPNDPINEVDLRTGLAWSGVDLSLFVNNLTNQTPRLYMSQRYIGGAASPLYTAFTLRPRTAGVTAVYRF